MRRSNATWQVIRSDNQGHTVIFVVIDISTFCEIKTKSRLVSLFKCLLKWSCIRRCIVSCPSSILSTLTVMTYWLCWIQNLPDQNKLTHPHPSSDLPSTHPPDLPYYLTYPPTYHYSLQDSDILSQIWPYQTYLTYPNTWPTYPPGLRTHLTYPPAWLAHLHSTITFRIQHCLKDNCQDLLLLPFPPNWHTHSPDLLTRPTQPTTQRIWTMLTL